MNPRIHILEDILSWKNKSFCVRPFLSVTLNQNGAFRLCCEDEKILPKQTLGNISDITIPQMKNSKKMKEIRKRMLAWKKIDECHRCQLKESRGIASLREKSNNLYFRRYINDIVYSSDIETWATTHPSIHSDIRFSNICNLSCRMCYSGSSSSRMELDSRLKIPVHKVVQDRFKIDDFLPVIDELQDIYIAGGEPLIDKNFIPFVEFLIQSWRSKNITLTVNTNLTIFSEIHRSLFIHFKNIRIVASCDGYGRMYEYVRIGAKWDTFIQNLIFVKKSLPFFGKWSGITVNTVVQIDNISNILQLVSFCHKMWVKHSLSILQVPETMYIWVIPFQKRQQILEIYKTYIAENSLYIPGVKEKLSEITNILSAQNHIQAWLYNEFHQQKIIIDEFMWEKVKA